MTPRILVTNDDGISAEGLAVLAEALAEIGEVHVYAPDRERSAVGHGVSLHRPLRVVEQRPRWYRVDGTPTDCVMLAVRDLMGGKPDLVVSGVNPGANLGDDVTYSGTVAGAFEGMLLGVPSLAISVAKPKPKHLRTGARVARKLARYCLETGLPEDTMLNINVPDLPYEALAGLSITRMGRRNYEDEIIRRVDPRGGTYYWIGGAAPLHVAEAGTDFEAVEQGKASVTPLHRDLTHHAVLHRFYEHAIEL
jgi:5'-nucleotidase